MVDVTISSNGDETIVTEVPKSYKEEYLNKLKDPEFIPPLDRAFVLWNRSISRPKFAKTSAA